MKRTNNRINMNKKIFNWQKSIYFKNKFLKYCYSVPSKYYRVKQNVKKTKTLSISYIIEKTELVIN